MAWDAGATVLGDALGATAGDAIGGAGIWSNSGGLLDGGSGLSAADLTQAGFDAGAGAGGGGMSLGNLSPYGALGSAASGILGAGAAYGAAGLQADAARNATAAQLGMFNVQNMQQAPYRQVGANALSNLNYLTGTNAGGMTPSSGEVAGNVPGLSLGSILRPFTAADLNANLAPNYEFMKQQGIGATTNALNARGGIGGNTLQGVTQFAENYAGNAYQNAFANYTANQTNIFNRLSSLAGLGQTANAQSTQLAGSLAPSIASSTIGAGTAAAGGLVGATNSITGGVNNALGWYALPSLINANG